MKRMFTVILVLFMVAGSSIHTSRVAAPEQSFEPLAAAEAMPVPDAYEPEAAIIGIADAGLQAEPEPEPHEPEPEPEPEPAEPEIVGPEVVEIVISAAGDCALGGDLRSGSNRFMRELNNQDGDYSYFLREVYPVFSTDDLTIVNMEGTFTESKRSADKTYALSAPPELVEIFTSGSVEAVTIANNHTKDYLQKGYDDTVSVLEDAGIAYFGDEYTAIVDIKGVRIGMFGYTMWWSDKSIKEKIAVSIRALRESGADIVIAYYHWGIELDYYPSAYQIDLAHHTVDSGADLVLGSHPHVLQGIEEYNGVNIVYSLGNFCFGANNNPSDKDTMIYRQTFVYTDGELTDVRRNIIPASISSVKERNDFQPVILEGEEAERVLAKIEKYSERLNQ